MDTSPEMWKVYIDLLRKMPPSRKLEQTCQCWTFIQAFAESGMRQRHPNADDREIFLRMARQNLGKELFREVYGDVLPDDTKQRTQGSN